MAAVPSLLKSAIKGAAHRDTNISSTVNSKPSCSRLEDNSTGVVFVVFISISYDDIVLTKVIAKIWANGGMAQCRMRVT